MVTIKNKELLEANGLEAIIKENGEVVIQKKEEVLENGGKWMPKEDDEYYSILGSGIDTQVNHFIRFKPQDDFEQRHLKEGTIFPTKEMAERVANKYVNAIKEEWEEYEKKINALNGGNNDERKD